MSIENLIDGKAIAEKIRGEIAEEVTAFREKTGLVPGLATVLVGEDPASQVYVRMKRKACEKLEILSEGHTLDASTSQEELLDLIGRLNRDDKIHGILVQLPLPDHIEEEKILLAISPEKDADGLHPANLGKLFIGKPRVIPCTPFGIIKLLEYSNVEIKGKDTVILGRSNLVGKPVSILLMQRHATVTICHTRTRDLAEKTRRADLLVVAAGKPEVVNGDMVKEGVVVIDVGVNRMEDGKLKGDVHFPSVQPKAAAITPVPGGVGPMTITMLLYNTLQSCKMLSELNGG